VIELKQYGMEQLLEYLNSIHPISQSLLEYLSLNLKVKTLQKKDFLLKKGRVNTEICFVQSGLLRCFYMIDEKEVSSWFMKEGDVIISVESFFTQKESFESIQAVEDSELYYITYEELQFIYKHYAEFNFIGRVLTERYYTLSEQRLFSMRMQRARDRYLYLLEHHSELILRVPSKYLASYLGIAEPTLSTIKSCI
jgi:CRP-like cAMP-binding protein